MIKYVQAEGGPGSYTLIENPIWNIPKEVGEVRFDMEFLPNTHHQIVMTIKGLAIDLDRRVYGMRKMHHPKQEGYFLAGRVSLGGKKYRAFTSSMLFEREDGSLVDVGVLIVHDIPIDQLEEVKGA